MPGIKVRRAVVWEIRKNNNLKRNVASGKTIDFERGFERAR